MIRDANPSSIASITSLRERVETLLAVLAEENQLLSGAGAELGNLDPILQRKQTLLKHLAEFTDEVILEQLKAQYQGRPEWELFVAKLADCQQQNLINGATMLEMLRMRENALRVLLGRSGQPQQLAYAADGRVAEEDETHRDLGQA